MRRIAVVVVVLLSALVGAPAVATAAPAPAYVALGDSFSSGVGTRVYFPSSGPCRRGPLAHPSLYRALHHIEQFEFRACAGATLDDVRAQAAGLPPGTDLVTLTAGGNDAGFARVLGTCSNPASPPGACEAVIAAGVAALPDVAVGMAALVAEIRAAAPGARVVVLGYPLLFGTGPCTAPGLPPAAARRAIDDGTALLDETLRAAATASGATFVDVRDRFAGHGTCAPVGSRWINPPTQPAFESYHPNIRGHGLGYLPELEAGSRASGAVPAA